uniref:Uncharacterized protein n=1 Tax=Wuchereria bancrofti TaxID=6293 RepID=A0AAF5PJL6_WUCBA
MEVKEGPKYFPIRKVTKDCISAPFVSVTTSDTVRECLGYTNPGQWLSDAKQRGNGDENPFMHIVEEKYR